MTNADPPIRSACRRRPRALRPAGARSLRAAPARRPPRALPRDPGAAPPTPLARPGSPRSAIPAAATAARTGRLRPATETGPPGRWDSPDRPAPRPHARPPRSAFPRPGGTCRCRPRRGRTCTRRDRRPTRRARPTTSGIRRLGQPPEGRASAAPTTGSHHRSRSAMRFRHPWGTSSRARCNASTPNAGSSSSSRTVTSRHIIRKHPAVRSSSTIWPAGK